MITEELSQALPLLHEARVAPYPPSWINRLNDWVETLPGPAWSVYLLLTLLLILVQSAIKWRDGAYPVGTFFPFHIVTMVSCFYFLAFIQALDQAAGRALVKFRPALNLDRISLKELTYRLTTLPARPVLLVTLAGILYGLLIVVGIGKGMVVTSAALIFTSPLASWFDGITIILMSMMQVLCVYHTIHQLRLISWTYSTCTKIDLFHLDPLFALSGLTAKAAIGWLLLASAWLATVSTLQTGAAIPAIISVVVILLALAAFLSPLQGIHVLLGEEKERAKAAAGERMKVIIGELHGQIDQSQRTEIGALTQAMSGLKLKLELLKLELELVDKIPTWPWQPETLRAVVTALLLPLAVWLVTHLFERVGGF